jgi:hypothetical protein
MQPQSVTKCLSFFVVVSLLVLFSPSCLADGSSGVANDDIDQGNSFQNGDSCQRDDDCQNGGTCTLADQFSDFNKCSCKHGHGGIYCEELCPLRCENKGSCRTTLDDTTQYECVCRGQYTGDLCQIPFVTCRDHTLCLHGGSCVVMDNITMTYGCHCPPGFDGGPRCSLNPNHTQVTVVAEIEDGVQQLAPVSVVGIVIGVVVLVLATMYFLRLYSNRRGYHRNVTSVRSTMSYSFDAMNLHDIEMI